MTFATREPATGKLHKRFSELSAQKIEQKMRKAEEAFEEWKKNAYPVRGKALKAAAEVLRTNQEDYARLITLEMGKPIREARGEIEKCAWVCDYYADHTKRFLRDETIKTEAHSNFVSYEPLGILFAIMPWNFPFWQVFRFAAPALMAGNVGLLKHASNVPQCAEAIQEVFEKANLPQGCFQNLLINEKKAHRLIRDQRVQAVTLTGSETAGRKVAATAGKSIKKTVLELGGSDPFVVLDDANLKLAADGAVQSRMLNSGQSCIAAKRFIVPEIVHDRFLDLLKKRVEALQVGDPWDDKTDIGPLARTDIAAGVMKQVKTSVQKGAEIAVGDNRSNSNSPFVQPAILKNVRSQMPVFKEEVFGPVMGVMRVKNNDQAIKMANWSKYGLGASLWTEDTEKGQKLARHLEAGNVFVNSIVKSDPRLPFGGIKNSGYGRELCYHGLLEFVNAKTISVNEGGKGI